jgi:hypothetical protein
LWFLDVNAVCTATDVPGNRRVIGTEFTPAGKQFVEQMNNSGHDPGNDELLQSVPNDGPRAVWTEASILRCERMVLLSRLAWPAATVIGVIFLGFSMAGFRARVAPPAKALYDVFISYSHEDSATAKKLYRALEGEQVRVSIDSTAMMPGQRIREFVTQSVRDSRVVVSIVSSASLASTWVALEAVEALERNKWMESRSFVACYVDEAFLTPECRLHMTELIDERLRRINELIREYAEKQIDTDDLNDEKTRLYNLRNRLGFILATLKDSLCLDLREPQFDKSVRRLLAAVRDQAGAAMSSRA